MSCSKLNTHFIFYNSLQEISQSSGRLTTVPLFFHVCHLCFYGVKYVLKELQIYLAQ